LIKKEVNLQSVNGNLLQITGQTTIPFQIGGIKMSHSFYVVSDMNRNVILGRDWLILNGVRFYFDLSCLRVQNKYIPLQENIHIASVLRLSNKTLLKPQTAYVCWTKDSINVAQTLIYMKFQPWIQALLVHNQEL
jgi:hypothetical protein